MKKFEYKVIDPGDNSTAASELNRLGEIGWELMCKWGEFSIILKREKNPYVHQPASPYDLSKSPRKA